MRIPRLRVERVEVNKEDLTRKYNQAKDTLKKATSKGLKHTASFLDMLRNRIDKEV